MATAKEGDSSLVNLSHIIITIVLATAGPVAGEFSSVPVDWATSISGTIYNGFVTPAGASHPPVGARSAISIFGFEVSLSGCDRL